MKNQRNLLFTSLSGLLAVPAISHAAVFPVTQATDDGTGLINGSLSWAILQANTTPGEDLIELQTDVALTGVMKRLVDSDVTIKPSGAEIRVISGSGSFRPLFVKSGQVLIEQLTISQGLAKGGDGGGAGLGGGLFIYAGDVTLSNVSITSNTAQGGGLHTDGWLYHGGGGMYGNSGVGGGGGPRAGGGLFAHGSYAAGGYGGYGNYSGNDPMFGRGGGWSGNGGFGAGGGGADYYSETPTGNGGFGGGAGGCYCSEYNTPGKGGFGGSGTFVSGNGFAAGHGRGAGLGGGVFIRSGTLTLSNTLLSGNSATASGDAEGLGGGLFVLHTLHNPNGNHQGMPQNLPVVNLCSDSEVTNNSARDDAGTVSNDDNVFDLGNNINAGLVCDVIFNDGFEPAD
jgi:hypothetical protein